MPTVDGLQKHAVAHRAARNAYRRAVGISKGMGSVAIQTQCCLKQEESDLDDDNGCWQQSSTAVQLVDAVRGCKPHVGPVGLSGACHAPFATKAPSEASTIFLP